MVFSWFLYLFSFFLPINLLIFDLRKDSVFSLSLSHKKEREREKKRDEKGVLIEWQYMLAQTKNAKLAAFSG